MRIGILTIGNELTSGKTQDTNTNFIARQLYRLGWQITAMLSVGDDDTAIKSGLDYLMGLADGLIVTGGLGPTVDDITTAAIARACGRQLIMDEAVLQHVKARMTGRGLKWTENNAKQALFPEGAATIENRVGTAWGFSLEHSGKIIAVMPGVPAEAEKMLLEGVIPHFRRKFSDDDVHVVTRIIKLTGVSESAVDQELAQAPFADLGVTVGFYPRFPELEVVLTARHRDRAKADEAIVQAEAEVVQRFANNIFAYDQDTLEGVVAALLGRKKLTLAVAESCTGGLLADRLTNVPGSSAFLERGLVTYSNASKEELLMVPPEVIRQHGAVSQETAALMAEGVRKMAHTDLGLAVTGIAGPDGGTAAKPVGTVFIALADGKKTACRHFSFRWDRRRIKVNASQWALMMLKNYLTDG
ncbi:MAG: competence/damage-inducible protein A [Deltaproteobacteria bacterium]|nr:competence/damage-inducible protein A [Deltaproteobacteria bacterium]